MANLTVTNIDGQLLVDSRLIAERLGITHEAILKTIDKHLTRLQAKSPVRFEIDVVKRPQGGTYNIRYAFLNEAQATKLMTYSRNTEQVLDCKDALCDAFEKAKALIATVIPAQSDRIKELELELQLTVAQTQKAIAEQKVLDTRHLIVTTCPEVVQQKILGYTEVKTIEYRDRTITPTGQINDGIGITYIQKRYGFKSTKETWAWLERLGMGKMDGKWKHELRAVESSVLPREYLDELDVMFGDSQRPLWLGE